ncbi:winged helix-turn-helix transcriptional regulator [Williamsia deligens]|uniref:Winged helix-turn-helix transcriptional regulator n=1 Tax=Williamsia deligens TaxID=321325 RepID=A0ABW3G5S3_9NOCA|nr:helix-turn-helix domain-containing protein [Williamsia deligens]MCP2193336.1 transcriptional regulator, HxlR family [Williamsia deligens]
MPEDRAIKGGGRCAIARTVDVLRDPWTFLIVREALDGVTRFSDFRTHLGVASDVLTQRLRALVDAGVLRREDYREPGARERPSYHLTERGADLTVVVAALQQWGDAHLPVDCGPTVVRRHRLTGAPVDVAFVDGDGHRVAREDVVFERTAAYPVRD